MPPTNIPLAKGDYDRAVAKEARLLLHNRYFEENPSLTETQVALIARPGLRRFMTVGDGPIRAIYSQAGSFENAAFVVSGDKLYRLDTNGDLAVAGTGLFSPDFGNVSMAATAYLGITTPEYLFVADGRNLWLYVDDGFATATLTGSGAISNTEQIVIGGIYYTWTNASVDAGSPAGTVGNPWLVALGGSSAEAIQNMANAINDSGVAGTAYSTALVANTFVTMTFYSANTIVVRAIANGVSGNSIAVSETGANLAWSGATLSGGGSPSFTIVPMPDDVGAVSVGYIASYVIVIPAQGEGVNGRFYWIDPGETTIDPLNFATAERAPDPVYSVVVFGDQFWLPGQSTTEVWYPSGDFDAPMLRLQGVTFDRGTWEGTAIQVKESMIIVDSDGGVFQIGGGIKRISRPDIEEKIRVAIQIQSANT